jgi:hypothetical protein
MPIANFNSTSGFGPGSRPLAERGVTDNPRPAAADFPALDFAAPEHAAEFPLVDAAIPVAAPVATVEIAEPTPVPVQPAISASFQMAGGAKVSPEGQDKFSRLDELIYDVARFPVTQTHAKPAVSEVSDKAVSTAEFQTVSAPDVSLQPQAAEVSAPAAAVSDDFDLDPFADEEFELALDDLELDLADVVVEENNRHVPASVVAAARTAPAAPVYSFAPAVVEPSAAAEPRFKDQDDADFAEPEADLPFDPALITEAEERPEAIADLDVPSLPAEEPVHEPVHRAEYDIDIDAELATLLAATSVSAPAAKEEPIAAAKAVEAPAAEPRSIYADLDEFERALEEDFRRSLATPLPAAERYADRNGYPLDGGEGGRQGSSRMWILPLAFVGVLSVVGAGAYAWLGNGVSGMVAGGEPVIITADKDPIKVAPENPGGKTVPNQDKAVYDRVAGAAPETPKQQTLISSNEAPVDVVQKTLMPDGLPLEGENDIEPTDVGETEDPRLLPQERPQQTAAAQDPVTVAPRKVKTMIVRPDGKLVEQEVAAPASTLAAIQSEKMPAAPAKSVEVAAMPREPVATSASATQIQPASVPAGSSPAGIVPVSAPVGPISAPLSPVKTDAVAPVQQPAAAMPAAKAPVPAMRPAQQPVNVVAAVTDRGNVRAPSTSATQPVPSAAAVAPAQVASLGDGGYVIQIASLPSQAEAQKSYQSLSSKFGSVIAGRGVDIKQAEISGKGTFYRVRIPAGSKTEAVSLCERYRSAGGTCLVAK